MSELTPTQELERLKAKHHVNLGFAIKQIEEVQEYLKRKQAEIFGVKDEVLHTSEDTEVESSGHLKG